jgi:hypothetical protein
MIKILLTVRNRLAMTEKCIEALKRHSTIPHQIYVYDNSTTYLLEEHFDFFSNLYKTGAIAQVTFTSDASTFNAFSKAVASNMFGLQHEQDPNKDSCSFLLFLDNDIMVTPKWDEKLRISWKYVNKNNLNNIKVVGQLPGGIKDRKEEVDFGEIKGRLGRLGGSALWSVRPNFFREVGFLPIKNLVGLHKQHDQMYWRLLEKCSGGKPYIMGINQKLGIHCGKFAGSVCNRLTRMNRDPKKLSLIKFEESEENIRGLTFEQFYNQVVDDKALINDW